MIAKKIMSDYEEDDGADGADSADSDDGADCADCADCADSCRIEIPSIFNPDGLFEEYKKRLLWEYPNYTTEREHMMKQLQNELDGCFFHKSLLHRLRFDEQKIILELSESQPFEVQLRRWENQVLEQQALARNIIAEAAAESQSRKEFMERMQKICTVDITLGETTKKWTLLTLFDKGYASSYNTATHVFRLNNVNLDVLTIEMITTKIVDHCGDPNVIESISVR